jgi:class 3 adenylate cyclase
MGQDIELAVVFADVVGSTHIYDVLGDQRARHIVGGCIDLMRDATEQHQGTVIKTMGDEVMSTFACADQALEAAAQMQRLTSTHPELVVEGQQVALRIGCHFGPVVLESRDVFGATVHTANRMTSQAKPGQIITTAATCQALSPEWRSAVRQIDVALIKGQGQEVRLFEVLWQADDVTSMLPSVALSGHAPTRERLRLRLLDQEYLLDGRRAQLTVGRADENDVIVRGALVSRVHARIEIARNKIVLVDQSTNGTFVLSAEGEEAFVRRDSLQLRGEGMVGFGRVPESASPLTLYYRCESADA